MKKFNNRCNHVSFIILILLTILTSCKKNKIKPYPSTPVKQISFSPSAAFIGDEVTLTGEFNPDKTKNTVSFGEATALITSASLTELKVIVPATAKNDKLTVSVNGVETTSSTNFTLYNIYVAGTEYDGGTNKDNAVIKYWKNGISTTLTDGTHDAFATSMNISGKDVYILGYENILGYNNAIRYWKNDIPVSVTDGSKDTYPTSIKVIGNDVYVVGYEYSNYGWATKVKYWKNGVGVALSDGLEEAYPISIAISGTDVYVVGYAYDDYYNISAKFWKNGKETLLSQPVGFSYYASDVAVIGGDVYISGTEQTSNGSFPIYWKNGIKYNIPTNNKTTFATSVIAQGNSFYITGIDQTNQKYTSLAWENGKTQRFSFSTNKGNLSSSFAIVDNNFFACGTIQNASAYWRNGIPTLLTDKKYYSYPCAIVIAP